VEGVELGVELFEGAGRARAVEQLESRHGAEARLSERGIEDGSMDERRFVQQQPAPVSG
jgi:hypothetical protein